MSFTYVRIHYFDILSVSEQIIIEIRLMVTYLLKPFEHQDTDAHRLIEQMGKRLS